jgi:gamma-glutamyl:cysteine ligase YbdK (ATP-grasp superfamily)
LAVLCDLLDRPGFGVGPQTFGAELEISLVDAAGQPMPINRAVLADALDPGLSLELDRFNLEYNAAPVALSGQPFSTIGKELGAALAKIDGVARGHGARLALIGILPTLCEKDLLPSAMTNTLRYRALSAGLRRLRSAAFRIEIEGDERIGFDSDDVTLEGANTSFQLHLRVPPDEFASAFNAAQMAAAPTLAVATNSPIFLSTVLWRETRVALFSQAVDYRVEGPGWRPSRVSFGHGWVRNGAAELFAESVALHSPILPITTSEDPAEVLRDGGIPDLAELRLHHGTVWSWNRAVYDPSSGGHVRIEMRCLPAGPTLVDMMANAAFLVGLTLGLSKEVDWMIPAMPFRFAHDNYYRAARHGLDAVLLWPSREAPSPRAERAGDLIARLIPIAHSGLIEAGVDAKEAERNLAVIAARVERRRTGACWQRAMLSGLEKRMPREDALAEMFARYLANADTGCSVCEWADDV